MITTATLIPVTADQITATDLWCIANESDSSLECYRVESPESAEAGNLIYAAGRGAIAWGAQAEWTDAESAQEVLDRWIAGEMVN